MLGATHWRVEPWIYEMSEDIAGRYGASWNSYDGHGLPPAAGEARTVDFWGVGGRGWPLPEGTGDEIAAWVLGQHVVVPCLVLIWWSWWWRPETGWEPYPGLYGPHGPGPDAHVHVGW